MGIEFTVYGFLVGILVGLTGMGGGSVMTAVLIVWSDLPPLVAVGTDLLYAATTKTAGAFVHSRRANVIWPVVARLAAGSIPGSLLTLAVLSRIPLHDPIMGRILTMAIGVALIAAALTLLYSGQQVRPQENANDQLTVDSNNSRKLATVACGFCLGVVVSATSVGAGALGIVVLRQLYPRQPTVRLVATDISHAVPLTLLAGSGHWLLGNIDWTLLGLLVLGSVPGIVIASRLAHHVPERIMRLVLAIVLLAIAVPLIAR